MFIPLADSRRSRRALRAVAAVGTVVALTAAVAGCAGAAHDPQALLATSTGTSAPGSPSAALLGSDDFYLITMNISNNTDSDLVVYSEELGHQDGSDGGHWNQQPTALPAN